MFGWTLDERGAFDVLDAFVASGGKFIDTAEDYSVWVPGNSGGESETILGGWMVKRGNRDRVVIATKVSTRPGSERLTSEALRAAAEDSLRRLQTDYIDLYYAHRDDEHTPLQETLGGFDRLVRECKVRHIGASNYTADRLAEALRVSDAEGLTRYPAVQPRYNLMERGHYEGRAGGPKRMRSRLPQWHSHGSQPSRPCSPRSRAPAPSSNSPSYTNDGPDAVQA